MTPTLNDFAMALAGATGASIVFGQWIFVAVYWMAFLACVALTARKGTSA